MLSLGDYHHLLRLPQRTPPNMRVGEIISRIGGSVPLPAFLARPAPSSSPLSPSLSPFLPILTSITPFTHFSLFFLISIKPLPKTGTLNRRTKAR